MSATMQHETFRRWHVASSRITWHPILLLSLLQHLSFVQKHKHYVRSLSTWDVPYIRMRDNSIHDSEGCAECAIPAMELLGILRAAQKFRFMAECLWGGAGVQASNET